MTHKILSSLTLSALTLLPFSAMAEEVSGKASTLDLGKVFAGSPLIYSVLILMSMGCLGLWIYSLLTLRLGELMPTAFMEEIRELLSQRRYETALERCQEEDNLVGAILASGISHRQHGSQVMLEAVQAEGKRQGMGLWQRLSLLNDAAMIAPMLGLLGTVMGMFLAFYDSNRTNESITQIFDGLGIAIGTTVAGLLVAIVAMICYTTLRVKLVKILTTVETETLTVMGTVTVNSPEQS